jgi:putative ABC transport system ATP-binding protein/macrolide transport system ATP-binding/permease protein/lipoprotein-releasing system ATP-binding protein
VNVLEVRGLSKVYQTSRGPIAALSDLDLQVERGEALAVCGHSGSGKSTLLGILGGLCRPTHGSVCLDGTDVLALGPQRLADFRGQQIGFVFQFSSLLPNLRAIDNVALPALIGGATSQAASYELAKDMLEQVGLGPRWDAFPAELSGGQQRRVAIARALINRPPLILADEPTSDLDEQNEQEILRLLLELRRTHNSTLILVTHNVGLAQYADRVIHLRRGRMVSADRTAAPLLPTPAAHFLADDEPALSAMAEPETEQPVPLGAGLGRFLVDFVAWTLAVSLGILALNHGVALIQRHAIAEKQEVYRATEELAMQKLRADLENITRQDDGSYQLSLYLLNPEPEHPFYVMGPALQAFLQVDRSWQAFPISPLENQPGHVTRIDGRHLFTFTFRADAETYDQLIAGYMHLRFSNSMIVAESAEPTNDLFNRTDDYYVYLKPEAISDDEVRRRNGWSASTLVPRWIPMKAH